MSSAHQYLKARRCSGLFHVCCSASAGGASRVCAKVALPTRPRNFDHSSRFALSLLSLCKSGFCTRPSIGAGFRVRVWNAFCLAIQPKQSADISHSKTIFDQRLRHAQTCRVLSWATRRGNAQLVSGDYRSATGARGSVDNRADSQRVESGVGVDVNGITPHAKS